MSIHITKIEAETHRPLLEIRVEGKLTSKDYESFVPEIEALMKTGKIRILLELIRFHGWTAGALWEDTKFAAKHLNDLERIAIAGDKKWEKGMATFCKPFTRATIRYFDSDEIERAKKWIMETKEAAAEWVSKVAK